MILDDGMGLVFPQNIDGLDAMSRFETQQAIVEAVSGSPSTPSSEQLLVFAHRGIRAPAALSAREIRDVCHALVVHYAQMGIG